MSSISNPSSTSFPDWNKEVVIANMVDFVIPEDGYLAIAQNASVGTNAYEMQFLKDGIKKQSFVIIGASTRVKGLTTILKAGEVWRSFSDLGTQYWTTSFIPKGY